MIFLEIIDFSDPYFISSPDNDLSWFSWNCAGYELGQSPIFGLFFGKMASLKHSKWQGLKPSKLFPI